LGFETSKDAGLIFAPRKAPTKATTEHNGGNKTNGVATIDVAEIVKISIRSSG